MTTEAKRYNTNRFVDWELGGRRMSSEQQELCRVVDIYQYIKFYLGCWGVVG
jgi:hypothetical protein